mmetsp:Transcript_15025/g.41812  ORF Transcript_15025/g.41812 Transcript_15025/m.41812 type:complete len:266 (+) Transcript_15025:294-1091(+)
MSSSQNGEHKRRITKAEKIAELHGKLKLLKEDNQRLRNEAKGSLSRSTHSEGSSRSFGERDKLKEALRALKKVTVKQEVSLASLREKAKERRTEIEHKNKIIKQLQQDSKAFRRAHEKMTNNDSDDVSVLRSQLADLELKLAQEENDKAEQSRKLKESEAGISSLQALLAKSSGGRGLRRSGSSDSKTLSVMSDSTSGEDVNKLKKELARKTERITNLEYELEGCKNEIHDLKERTQFHNSFPTTPAPGELDFFEDDDGFWEGFQ